MIKRLSIAGFALSLAVLALAQSRRPVGFVQQGCPASTASQVVVSIPGANLRQPMACLAIDMSAFVQDSSTMPPVLRFKGTPGQAINFMDSDPACPVFSGQTLTLASTPNPAASFKVYVNGLKQQIPGVDYVLSGNQVTFPTPVEPGDSLTCEYRF